MSVRGENAAAWQKALRARLTAKATALVALRRSKAAETEGERRIPDEILAAIPSAVLSPNKRGSKRAPLTER